LFYKSISLFNLFFKLIFCFTGTIWGIFIFMDNINFEVVKHFGVISEEKSGWKKELNLVSWNGRVPKLDIRDWAPGHEKMGKGVTLTEGEAAQLAELLVSALAKPEG
jgi:hypothetical protein